MKKKLLFLLSLVAMVAVVILVNHAVTAMAAPGVITAMALTGYTRSCGFQSGGIKTLYLAECASVTSFTLTLASYSAVTMANSAVFKKYDFEPDTCELTEESSVANNSVAVKHGLNFLVNKMSVAGQTMATEILTASACGMIAIAVDCNGVKWVVGYSENMLKERYLQVKTIKGQTGKKLTEASQYDFALECEDNQQMKDYTGTVPLT